MRLTRRFFLVASVVAPIISLNPGLAIASDIAKAVELLTAAFACPIKPIVKKEVRNGVMLFYNGRIFEQKFSGDQSRLKFIFNEQFTQKSEPGLGGSFEANYRREGDAAFKDLQGGSIHGEEGQPTIWLRLACAGGQACYTEVSDGKTSKRANFDVMFCDRVSAQDALLAINVLRKAAR